jgi:hypothetical protein
MANLITLQVRKQFTKNGFANFAPTNKAVAFSTQEPYRVIPFADTSDTSIYAMVISNPVVGVSEQFYCAQTVATIVTAANA